MQTVLKDPHMIQIKMNLDYTSTIYIGYVGETQKKKELKNGVGSFISKENVQTLRFFFFAINISSFIRTACDAYRYR